MTLLAGQPATGLPPTVVLDVEVSEAIPAIPGVGPDGSIRSRAWLLIRVFDLPIGTMTVPLGPDGCSPETLTAAIDDQFGPTIRTSAAAAGTPLPPRLPSGGFRPVTTPPHHAARQELLRRPPVISVVISTRDRPDTLARCVDAVCSQRYPLLQLIVVDNAPSTDATRRWANRYGDPRLHYVSEPKPGLSFARNAGIRTALGDVVAFIDDDEVPDPHWLVEIARTFADHPAADAVSGTIVPAELVTPAQELFERFGGHSKGRGFAPAVFTAGGDQHPMYPLPPFGTGGNMAFRRSVFGTAGVFDTALGAGTSAQGGEDTEIFTRLLLRGSTIVYQPSVLVRHFHRRTDEGLHAQMRGYGVGLTAYYMSLLWKDPRRLPAMLGLVPTALRDTFGRDGRGLAAAGADFPEALLTAKRRGMLSGPFQYVRSRVTSRRLARGEMA